MMISYGYRKYGYTQQMIKERNCKDKFCELIKCKYYGVISQDKYDYIDYIVTNYMKPSDVYSWNCKLKDGYIIYFNGWCNASTKRKADNLINELRKEFDCNAKKES